MEDHRPNKYLQGHQHEGRKEEEQESGKVNIYKEIRQRGIYKNLWNNYVFLSKGWRIVSLYEALLVQLNWFD